MFELLSVGEKFLSTLDAVGDWLLFQPFSVAVGLQPSSEYTDFTNFILDFLSDYPDLYHINVGSLIIGSSLTFVLGYKVFKFFTNLL